MQKPLLECVSLAAAMPAAVNTFIFAQRYQVFVRETGEIVFISSVLSLFTLSGLLLLFGFGT